MVASAVFITDLSGKSIISRNYRGDVPLTQAIEHFTKYLHDTPDEQKKPIFYRIPHTNDYVTEEDVDVIGYQHPSSVATTSNGGDYMKESNNNENENSSSNDGETFVYINVSF
jgi:hypothetical protein